MGAHAREFRYRTFMAYLDLAELPAVFEGRWLWSAGRPSVAWFRRADYLGDPRVPLSTAVRDRVEAETGRRPAGPIRVLTHLRYFGHTFNPVSFYYCFDTAGARIETIVAEITNTPWNERQAYVLPAAEDGLRFRFAKQFHVSPFFPMDHQYQWRFSPPGATLSVHMENYRLGEKHFDATLSLTRRPIQSMVLAAYPLHTVKVVAAIYWQALQLLIRRVPFFNHPKVSHP